jgi:hypothetical protein
MAHHRTDVARGKDKGVGSGLKVVINGKKAFLVQS